MSARAGTRDLDASDQRTRWVADRRPAPEGDHEGRRWRRPSGVLARHGVGANFIAPCVLEIVDRNSHGLMCLLVHTERNSSCSTEGYDIPGEQSERLHRRLNTSKEMNALHLLESVHRRRMK